jgi:hypothetical protein
MKLIRSNAYEYIPRGHNFSPGFDNEILLAALGIQGNG